MLFVVVAFVVVHVEDTLVENWVFEAKKCCLGPLLDYSMRSWDVASMIGCMNYSKDYSYFGSPYNIQLLD